MRLPASLALLAVGGCGALEESQSTEQIVSVAAPYRYDSPYSIVPDLGVSGTATSASPLATDAGSIHEPTFSNGVTSKAPVATDMPSWLVIATGGPGGSWAQFESSPAFSPELTAAASDADASMSADDDQLASIESFLESLPIALHVSNLPPTQYFYGWPADQARWLRQAYAVINPSTGLMANQVYAEPMFGAEIRDRGARLYCAARAAAFNQHDSKQASMGQQAALTVSIFGQTIQLGVVEPTFRFDVPQKHIGGGADGSQTFEIPLQVGAQITPIGGLGLPGFDELRYPLALITGDTEVASNLPLQSLHTGDSLGCSPWFGCWYRPSFSYVHPKDYLTVTHADAVRGRSAHLDAHTDDIPLFTMGAFVVTFRVDGGIDVGKPTTATPPDDRVLQGVPSWWPLISRTGDQTPSPFPGYLYDSEPWGAPSSIDSAPGAVTSFGLPGVANVAQFSASDPLLMRALEDDDHHLQTATSASLAGHVNGWFGFDLGIAHFELHGEGSVGVTGAVQMDVRDGEMALPQTPVASTRGTSPAIPLTALTATPSTSASAYVGFTVDLKIHIPLVFSSIDEDISIIDASAEHTWGGSPWAQQNRVLLATGSSWGDPRTQPWAVSHLPFTGTPSSYYPAYPIFNSFDQSVDACLADPTTPEPPPAPCHAPAPKPTPHGNLCVFSGSWLDNSSRGYGLASSWSGVCSAVPSHVDAILGATATPSQKQCLIDTISSLCKPVSLEQDWQGQHGVAHILDTLHPGNDIDIGALASECATAFEPQDHTVTFNRIFAFGPCDDSATMIDPKNVVVPSSPPDGTPSPVTPGTCN